MEPLVFIMEPLVFRPGENAGRRQWSEDRGLHFRFGLQTGGPIYIDDADLVVRERTAAE